VDPIPTIATLSVIPCEPIALPTSLLCAWLLTAWSLTVPVDPCRRGR